MQPFPGGGASPDNPWHGGQSARPVLIKSFFQALGPLWAPDGKATAPRGHLRADTWPSRVHVIGDVHGCLDLLLELEEMILTEHGSAGGEEWLVMLGDYIDRGPRSASVIDHLLAPMPTGLRRICLAGNHEMMLFETMTTGSGGTNWLANGGDQTLRSYGMDPEELAGLPRAHWPMRLMSVIPREHLEFLKELALSLSLPRLVCVHAGVRPHIAIEQQSEADLLWLRPTDDVGTGDGRTLLVHGHTPVHRPYVSANRINIDTGAFATGRLTAVTLDRSRAPEFLSTGKGL